MNLVKNNSSAKSVPLITDVSFFKYTSVFYGYRYPIGDLDCQKPGERFGGSSADWRLGEREIAIQRLTAAVELRERVGHGLVEETRRALEAFA